MNKLPNKLSFRKIRFKLEAIGFNEIKQLNNHAKFIRRREGKINTVVLPHYTEISASVVRSVLKQANISQQDFDRL